ncbi:MAG: NACHT domain-containing protein [Chloroflexota bacterium]
MPPKKRSTPSSDKNVFISGDVVDSVVIAGDNNQTFFQKIVNIFKSDAETLEQRNRRILLGHVETAWIKGVLDASLHGAALLDLGIKQDPEAVTKYPWAIKKESTNETLPAGTSMQEIFDSIGMGRSLLILGAPGSGKTTMLLELARQLIARAREDITYPIPMVFNLASWTEKLTLADWLAQELNNLYSIPRKTAPDWVKGNKLLLLLDGLDEVRQESRAKCVEAINEFRKEHGLTSLAVCSRSQDYADLKAKLSFEGAIEVQPLTQKQITEFFNRFGKELAGIKQVLQKDSTLREMAETPLFLSIMIMAYRDKQDIEILVSQDEKAHRKHLFDTYIERMFERARKKNAQFKKQDVLQWLSWLANKMVAHNAVPYVIEEMQPEWLAKKRQRYYGMIVKLIDFLNLGLCIGLIFGVGGLSGLIVGLFFVLLVLLTEVIDKSNHNKISTIDFLSWSWEIAKKELIISLISWLLLGLSVGVVSGLVVGSMFGRLAGLMFGLNVGLLGGLSQWIDSRLQAKQISQIKYPEQKLSFSGRNFLIILLSVWLIIELLAVLLVGTSFGLMFGLRAGLLNGLGVGLGAGLAYGGSSLIQHYTLRYILARNNLLPWRLVPFLDHCVDLIFLRRVGGGYIFVHRLLMEHFAEMYVETLTSKGN